MIIIFKVSTQLKTRAKNVNKNLRTVLYLCGGFLAVVSQTSALVYFWSGKNLPLTWRRHFGGFSAVLKFLVASLGSLWFPWQDLTSCRRNLLTVFSFLTYHYNRPLGNIVLFVVMLMRKEKKMDSQPRPLSVWSFQFSLRGLSRVLLLPPTFQRCAQDMNWYVHIVPVWVSVGVCVRDPGMEGRPVQSHFPSCAWAARTGSSHPRPWTGKLVFMHFPEIYV